MTQWCMPAYSSAGHVSFKCLSPFPLKSMEKFFFSLSHGFVLDPEITL